MVLDWPGDEDDPLAQQPGINVEAALAPVRLFDNDGNEAGDDVLMVHGKCGSLNCVGPYIGPKSPRFKPRMEKATRTRQAALPCLVVLERAALHLHASPGVEITAGDVVGCRIEAVHVTAQTCRCLDVEQIVDAEGYAEIVSES